MSLAFLLYPVLLFCIFPLTSAGPRSTSSLSPQLKKIIPLCAQPCLEDFIAQSFSTATCQNKHSLGCLCTRASNTGFTLGEGAVRCLASDCTGEPTSEYKAVYEVCASVTNAQPMTHGTITASIAGPTTILLGNSDSCTLSRTRDPCSPASATDVSATASPVTTRPSSRIDPSNSLGAMTSITTATGTPSPPHSTPLPIASLTQTTEASSTVNALPVTSLAGSPSSSIHNSYLTTPQIAGIALGSAITVSIVILIVLFLCCRRKKRKTKRNSGSSFGGDEIVGVGGLTYDIIRNSPRGRPVEIPPPRTAPAKAQRLLGVPPRDQRRWSLWKHNTKPEDIGMAMAPELANDLSQDVSPISAASYRTTSELLPDKPLYRAGSSPFLQPSRSPVNFASGVGLRVINSTPTPPRPSRDAWQSSDTSQAPMQGRRVGPNPSRADPFLDTSNDTRQQMYAMERRLSSRSSRLQLPRIVTGNTRAPPGNSWNVSPQLLRPPPTFLLSTPSVTSKQIRTSIPNNLEPRPIRPGGHNEQQSFSFSGSNESQTQFSKYAPLKARHSSRRPLTHLTTGSDTSFEDDGDVVDEMHPQPKYSLSPVAESPRGVTPLGRLRYPAVPGKATSPKQLKPTSPQSPTPSPRDRPIRKPSPVYVEDISTNFSYSTGNGQQQPIRHELSAYPEPRQPRSGVVYASQ